ncbi:MAG: hypothetical protein KY475_03765 [Planctomycetes bacterium]|nr:hypothetical protein [Planctomycetota bacterium]
MAKFSVVLLASALAAPPVLAQPPDDPRAPIENALRQPTQFAFDATPLAEAMSFLEDKHRIPVFIDVHALAAAGMRTDQPVMEAADGVTLAEALDQILTPHRLAYFVKNDVLFVTTEAFARQIAEVRVYRVADHVSVDELPEDLMSQAAPDTWYTAEGWGRAFIVPPKSLVVVQNPLVHRQIAQRFSESLRLIYPTSRPTVDVPGLTDVTKHLRIPARMEFIETPLPDVAAFISHKHKVAVSAGDFSNVVITSNLGRIRLGNALTLMLRPRGLTWIVDDGVITAVTHQTADRTLTNATYPIQDLAQGDAIEPLQRIIESAVALVTWSDADRAALQVTEDGALEVRQSFPVHQEISALLSDLRRAAEK